MANSPITKDNNRFGILSSAENSNIDFNINAENGKKSCTPCPSSQSSSSAPKQKQTSIKSLQHECPSLPLSFAHVIQSGTKSVNTQLTSSQPAPAVQSISPKHTIPQDPLIQSNPFYPPIPSVSNSKTIQTKAFIVGDSHIKRLSKNVIKHHLNRKDILVKNFDGAKTKHVMHHTLPYLHENLPETVVIHTGTNDINEKLIHVTRPDELARSIIDIGKTCKGFGVKNVGISSILPRNDKNIQRIIKETNKLLRDMSDFYNFIFIDNSNINVNLLSPDNIHLSDVVF